MAENYIFGLRGTFLNFSQDVTAKMKINNSSLALGLIIGLLFGGFLGWYIAPRGTPTLIRITTSGSTTIHPLSTKWAEEYTVEFPSVQIQVSAGGSGLGQTQAAEGIVDIGASSSYPDSDYLDANPTVKVIPVAADALAVISNNAVNGSAGFRLTRNQAISIFNGSIVSWEDFETTWDTIVEVTGSIEVYVRSDASGTTATFGKWLEGGIGWSLGHKESISWPGQPNFHAVDGNPGVKSGVQSDPNGIGYVGLAYLESVSAAELYNEGNDEWVSPSPEAAKIAIPTELTDPGDSLMDSPTAGAYPIVRLLFYLVNTNYVRTASLEFVRWCLTTGQNPTWIQVDVGYLDINDTGAQTLALNIIDGITPISAQIPIPQNSAMVHLTKIRESKS
ncbi:MAG: PstS family phosphate ABC transporter substrate-binding protein [Promethearchaeota archaeon]